MYDAQRFRAPIEKPLMSELVRLFTVKKDFDVFMIPRIDGFITDANDVHFGVPIDLDISPNLKHILDDVNRLALKFGLPAFHKVSSSSIEMLFIQDPNPHISFASIEDPRTIPDSAVLEGPPGSQFYRGVCSLPNDMFEMPVSVSGIQLKVSVN